MKRLILGGAAVLLLIVGYRVGRARANGIPQTGTMSYNGRLLSFGQPADSGTTPYMMSLAMYVSGQESSGTPLCSTDPASVTVSNGAFTIPVPDACVPQVHANPNIDVVITVNGTVMPPRPLNAVPYAVETDHAVAADSASNPSPGSAIDALSPAGSVIAYAGDVNGTTRPPTGWVLCDGSSYAPTGIYSRLFAVIGTTYGGDGVNTFKVPDYRGYFLRGVDQGSGHDPDATSRTSVAGTTPGATEVGTFEHQQVVSHSHGVSDPGHYHGPQSWNGNQGPNNFIGDGCGGSALTPTSGFPPHESGATRLECETNTTSTNVTNISINAAGGSETRPSNMAVNYLIKL
jgi:microcystin-dependent protein